jgi:hypothetical protein
VRRLAILIICACALPVTDARAWTWPVDGPVLRPFAFDHAHPYAAGLHRGVDLGAPTGSRVLAPAEGIVSFAGTVPTGGKTVSIQTSSGYTATLVHLGSIGVVRGTLVGEGSVVGTVGPSGVVDLAEPYVYFGARTTSDPQGYVDPLTLLPSRPAPLPSPAAEPAASAAPAPAVPAPVSAPAVGAAGAVEAEATAPVPHAAPAVDAAASSASQTVEAAPAATVGAAAAVTAGEASSSPVTSELAPPASVTPARPANVLAHARAANDVTATPLAKVKLRRARTLERVSIGGHAIEGRLSGRQTLGSERAGISQTSVRSAAGGWRLPAGLAVAATAALLALRGRLRRKPLDTLPIMDIV